jgi:hypothetical protein
VAPAVHDVEEPAGGGAEDQVSSGDMRQRVPANHLRRIPAPSSLPYACSALHHDPCSPYVTLHRPIAAFGSLVIAMYFRYYIPEVVVRVFFVPKSKRTSRMMHGCTIAVCDTPACKSGSRRSHYAVSSPAADQRPTNRPGRDLALAHAPSGRCR